MAVLVSDKEFIDTLRGIGVKAKAWRNSGEFIPPADVNYKGELRVHTGGQPELIATDETFKQAVIQPTFGRYQGQSFLVGMDETSNFVCRLPQPVKTVQEAHEILKPLGIGDHAKRQGEWFMTPKEICACGRALPKTVEEGNDTGHYIQSNRSLGETTHRAEESFRCSSRVFARGFIADERVGRHAPLNLGTTWHEAQHNTELSLDREPSRPRKVRSFD